MNSDLFVGALVAFIIVMTMLAIELGNWIIIPGRVVLHP